MSLHDRGDGTMEFTDGSEEKALLVCETYSSDENWNGECDLCVIPVTADFLRLYQRKMYHYQSIKGRNSELKDLLWLTFFDYSPSWIAGTGEVYDFLGEELDSSYFTLIMGESVEQFEKLMEGNEQRIEGSTLCVADGSVWYECYVKHTNVKISSYTLQVSIIQMALETLEIENPTDPNLIAVVKGG